MFLFDTMIFVNGTAAFYNVSKDGIMYIWEPAPGKNHTDSLPVFMVHHEGNNWIGENSDHTPIDQDIIAQAVEDLKGYYFNK